MRDAIARAPVGDDQYGEDPTTNRLQDRIAKIAVTHLDVTHEQCERAAPVLVSVAGS